MERRRKYITSLPFSTLPSDLFPESRPLSFGASTGTPAPFRSISGIQSMDSFRSIGTSPLSNSPDATMPITPKEPNIDKAGIIPPPSLTLGRRLYPNLIASNNYITDPIERIIADALTLAGIAFKHERNPDRIAEEKVQNAAENAQGSNKSILDFKLEDGLYIEVKQYSSDRSNKQLASQPNVILIQGRMAAYWFAEQLLSPKIQTPPAPINLFQKCISAIRKALR